MTKFFIDFHDGMEDFQTPQLRYKRLWQDWAALPWKANPSVIPSLSSTKKSKQVVTHLDFYIKWQNQRDSNSRLPA